MKEIIVKNQPKSPISESYRSIRTNIQFANVDNNIKTILVTSSVPGEGKTTTLSNVAFSMADLGHRVLVIDCDLRKPRVHKVFDLSNAEGITDILLGSKDYKDYIRTVSDGKLDVLTSGKVPGNPSELLESDAMKRFISQVKEEYDYVMIDTPPTLPVADSAIMSTYIDGVIIVCSSGKVEVNAAKKAVESLKKVEANILGVVLTKVPIKAGKHNSYYYYYYYANEEKGNNLERASV